MERKQGEKTYESWHAMIEKRSKTQGNKVFVESLDQNRRITFREFRDYCNRLANFLKEKKLGKDDRITLIGRN